MYDTLEKEFVSSKSCREYQDKVYLQAMIERSVEGISQLLQERLRKLQIAYTTADPEKRGFIAQEMGQIAEYLHTTAEVIAFARDRGDVPLDYEIVDAQDHPLVVQEIARWNDTHQPEFVDSATFDADLQRELILISPGYDPHLATKITMGQALVGARGNSPQMSLAEDSGLSTSYISLIASGKRELTVKSAVNIIMGGYKINPDASEAARFFLNKLAHMEAPNGFSTRR